LHSVVSTRLIEADRSKRITTRWPPGGPSRLGY
jgi:hypothetical protein